ncbi:hypothetical protein K490DRAFT_52648 [Saccharata proteae CBS 121410]|uniref:BZIP domain-containing protein n=1 Tax=Saccharata proteae CBS 121410 TaxID=1314787 RepID=A0A9P4HY84_9PEZI|nr:hypothetical protein K490DRAFT_52648 [Saccharata proteae CBS 121410]
MEPQQYEYWLPTDVYAQNPGNFYTPDLSSIPSLTASPTPTTFDGTPTPTSLYSHGGHARYSSTSSNNSNSIGYSTSTASSTTTTMPMTPSEFGSADDLDQSPYCSPSATHHDSDFFSSAVPLGALQQSHPDGYQHHHLAWPIPTERTHTTSGRRRAQNRAAQRAFRERKEKHARDIEQQLAALTARYGKLESSHKELGAAMEGS